MTSVNACLSHKALLWPRTPQCRKQMHKEYKVKEYGWCLHESCNPETSERKPEWEWWAVWVALGMTGCGLTNHHFACTGLVCEMFLHIKQSSFTYICSPDNNTPCTKGCLTEHVNTWKSALKSYGKFRIFFLSSTPLSYTKAFFTCSFLCSDILFYLSLTITFQIFHSC